MKMVYVHVNPCKKYIYTQMAQRFVQLESPVQMHAFEVLIFPWSGIIMHSHVPQVLNISDLIE